MKVNKFLIPNYVDNFECIGSKCEDHCCKNWRITIDKITYKKYKKLSNPELKQIINKSISRNRKSTNDYDYGKFILNENKNCPLMDDLGLCDIHKNLGAEYLCHTCQTYPRQYTSVNNIIEKNLTLSCPEVARQVLLNENGIDFYLVESTESPHIKRAFNTNISKNIYTNSFWELRIFIIEILQDRNYSIEERLAIIGLFLESINTCSSSSEINNTIQKYMINLKSLRYKGAFSDLNSNINFTLDFMIHIHNNIFINKGVEYKYNNVLNNTITGLKLNDKEFDHSEIYKSLLEKEYANFSNAYSYILENYLVNYVYKSLFLINTCNTLNNYAELIIKFALIKLNLIGMVATNREDISKEIAVDVIHSFTAFFDHDTTSMPKMINYLETNNFNTLSHMMLLIL